MITAITIISIATTIVITNVAIIVINIIIITIITIVNTTTHTYFFERNAMVTKLYSFFVLSIVLHLILFIC